MVRTNQVKWVSFAFGPVRKGPPGDPGAVVVEGIIVGEPQEGEFFWDRGSRPLCIAVLAPSAILLSLLQVVPLKNCPLIHRGDCI